MGNAVITKAARVAARQATVAAQEELARRTRCNAEDLARFFSAREREDSVQEWLGERTRRLAAQAEARRAEQRRQGGAALAAMQARGEQVRDIARMAGVSEKTVKDLLKAAGEAPIPDAGEPAPAPPAREAVLAEPTDVPAVAVANGAAGGGRGGADVG